MKAYLKLIAILLLPLVYVIWYANSSVQIPPPGWKLSKAPMQAFNNSPVEEERKDLSQPLLNGADTSSSKGELERPQESLPPREEVGGGILDSTSQRILFFGDSMVEGLLRRMNCYAYANGHKVTNVVWYSSTTKIWAKTDTLRYFINKVKPTFAMICIGGNEQFIKDTDSRESYIRMIINDLGGIPFVWIGVPAWKEDTGINELTQRVVGKSRYFDSRGLTLRRGRDHMHPTYSAASEWMDSVALWMASPQTAHPIRMEKPTDGQKHTYTTYALQPIRH